MVACKQVDVVPNDYHSVFGTRAGLKTTEENTVKQSDTGNHYRVQVEKVPLNKGTVSLRREETCYDVWQVYIDVNSGDIVGRDYLGLECSGGGDDGGGGGGGPNNSGDTDGSHTFPNGIYDEEATIQQQQPTLGNYAATLLISPSFYQVINVRVEIDLNTKDIKKIVVTMNGVTWLTKYTQIGDGVMTGYDPSTDTYSFRSPR